MLIGHEKLAKDFKQLAQNGRLAHGYLFSDSRASEKNFSPLAWRIFLKQEILLHPPKFCPTKLGRVNPLQFLMAKLWRAGRKIWLIFLP